MEQTEETKNPSTPPQIDKPLPVDFDTLVLSGGAVKGMVILGSLQYAKDFYLLNNITTYIGTSVGGIICYLLAIGYTPIEIVVYICTKGLVEKLQHFDLVSMVNGGGAASYHHIQEVLEKMTISKIGYLPTLQDIHTRFNKTLIFVTYNISKNKAEYLDPENYPNLPCITAIRMTSNIPLVFEHFKYGDSFYIDGGVSNNFAIEVAEKRGNKILGIILWEMEDEFDLLSTTNILEYIFKLIRIPVSQDMKHKLDNYSRDKCKVMKLEYNDISPLDFNITAKDKLDMFSNGYQQMKDLF